MLSTINDKLYQAFEQHSDKLGMFGTGNTYGGHPVAAAVALETLKIYQERDIVNVVKQRSERFSQRIDALGNHTLVGEARSVGLIGAIEFVKDKATKEQYPVSDKVAAQVMAAARKHGVIVRAVPGDGIAFCPPLVITDEQTDALFDGIQAALDDVRRSLATT